MITYHLAPKEAWEAAPADEPYRAPTLAVEGFTHCTTGVDEMVATADRHYGHDRRAFVVLTVDLDTVGAPWRYDAPGERYPHVYGPLARAAILRVVPMPRHPGGRFGPFPP